MHDTTSLFRRGFATTLSLLAFLSPSLNADWDLVSGGLPAPHEAESVVKSPTGTLFMTGQASTDPILYRSDDGGTTWALKENGILNAASVQPGLFRIGAFNGITFIGTDGGKGAFYSTDEGDNWTAVNMPEGNAFYEFERVNGSTFLATSRESSYTDSGVWVSTDNGVNWTNRSNGLEAVAYIPTIGPVIPTEDVIVHNDKWFAAVNGRGLFRSVNEGISWQAVNSGIDVLASVGGTVIQASSLASTPGRLWAVADYRLWMSEDDGGSWTEVAGDFGYSFSYVVAENSTVYALGYSNLSGSARVFVTDDGDAITYTTDSGLVGAAVADPVAVNGSRIFVATGSGLYVLDTATDPLESIPPVVTEELVGGTFFEGSAATLTVSADGTGPLGYQWRKNGSDIVGATSATLTLDPLALADAGNYDVVVSGPGGSATSISVAVAVSTDLPGRVDPTFEHIHLSDTQSSSWSDAVLPKVGLLLYEPNGKFWISGRYEASFRVDNGFSFSLPDDQQVLKRANADGTFDLFPSPPTGEDGHYFEPAYDAILEADGSIVAPRYLGEIYRNSPPFDAGSNEMIVQATLNGGGARILAMEALPDGRFFVAGRFDEIRDSDGNNPVTRNNVALLNADGSVDTSFDPGTTFSLSNRAVRALAYDEANQRLYVGGDFYEWGSVDNQPRLVALDLDGSVDVGFPAEADDLWRGDVYDLLLDREGRLLVGGKRFDSPTLGRQLDRLLPDGSRDPSFNPGGYGPNAEVFDIALNPDGGIVIGGKFTNYNGAGPRYLTLLNPDGTLNTAFNAGGIGPDDYVGAVAPSPDGQWILFGMDEYSYHSAEGTQNFYYYSVAAPDAVITRVRNDVEDLVLLRSPAYQAVAAGGDASFAVEAFAKSGAESYQWYKDGVAISGATDPELELTNVQAGDEGNYHVVVTDASGALSTEPVGLFLLGKPFFVSQPSSSSIGQGDTLELNPEVVGVEPMSLQWYRDGSALPGETSATLLLEDAGFDAAGDYYLEASNSEGTTDSVVANVEVTVTPGYIDTTFAADVGPSFTRYEIRTIHRLDSGKLLIGGEFTSVDGTAVGNFARLNEDGSLDASFAANGAPAGTVNTIVEQEDGKIVVGGEFSGWDGDATHRRLIRLNADGSIDAAFRPDPNHYVDALYVDGNGDGVANDAILVGGQFTSIDGTSQPYLAKLNSGGSLDAGFSPPSFSMSSGFGISKIRPMDGDYLVLGGFYQVDGQNQRGLVVLKDNGSPSADWPALNLNLGPFDAVPTPDGGLLVGGAFYQVAGQPRYRLVKFNSDATLDPDFLNTSTSTVINDTVNAILPTPGGGYILAGKFTEYDGVTCQGIIQIDEDGKPVSAYQPFAGTRPGQNEFALSSGGGQLFHIGGNFSEQGSVATAKIARFYYHIPELAITEDPADGYAEPGGSATFTVEAVGRSELFYRWYKNGVIIPGEESASLNLTGVGESDEAEYTARVLNEAGAVNSKVAEFTLLGAPLFVTHPASSVLAAGGSVSMSAKALGIEPLGYQWYKNGNPLSGETAASLELSGVDAADAALYSVVASNAEGSAESFPAGVSVEFEVGGIDENFDTTLTDSGNFGLGNATRTIVPVDDGGFILGYSGNDTFRGSSNYGIHKLKADGSNDPLFTSPLGSNPDVYDISKTADGKLVFVGSATIADGSGGFVNGGSNVYIARLNADGSYDPSWAVDNSDGFEGRWVRVLDDGSVLAVGDTGSKKWLADGSVDSTYNSFLLVGGSMRDVAITGDGAVVAVGSFTHANGVSSKHIAKFAPDGTRDPAFPQGTSFDNNDVWAVAVQSDGKILVGGRFNAYNGDTSQPRLTRLKADGTPDSGFSPGNLGSYYLVQVRSIALLPNDKIAVGGRLEVFDGDFRPQNVVRLNGDGSLNNAFDMEDGTNAYYTYVHPDGKGGFFAVGPFSNIGSTQIDYFARYNADPPATAVTAGPLAQNVEMGAPFRFAAAAVGTAPLEFQWQLDGSDLTGAIGPQYGKAAAQATDLGSYSVVVIDGESGSDSGAAELEESVAAPILSWAASYGLSGADAEPDADSDQDGKPNLLEYAMGTDPTQADTGNTPTVGTLTSDDLLALDPSAPVEADKSYLAVQFWKKSGTSGFSVTPRFATSLTGLSGADDTGVFQAGPPQVEGDFEVHTYYYGTAIEDSPSDRGFMQLLLSLD